jgi:hypothetical protein
MYKSVSRTADPHSKSILHADQKMEQKSFQTLSESKEISNDDLLRSQGTQSTILKLKNSVSKKAETYFGGGTRPKDTLFGYRSFFPQQSTVTAVPISTTESWDLPPTRHSCEDSAQFFGCTTNTKTAKNRLSCR